MGDPGRLRRTEPGGGVGEDLGSRLEGTDLVGERPVVEVPEQTVVVEVAAQRRRRRQADVADDPDAEARVDRAPLERVADARRRWIIAGVEPASVQRTSCSNSGSSPSATPMLVQPWWRPWPECSGGTTPRCHSLVEPRPS